MRKIESISDDAKGVMTYELDDGRWITLDAREVAAIGLWPLLRRAGVESTSERQPVFQDGRKIGTVPGDFEPLAIRSKHWLYEPRRGDFTRSDRGWEANGMLGPGDLDAVSGFVWDQDSGERTDV
jgi:hypothetical protein